MEITISFIHIYTVMTITTKYVLPFFPCKIRSINPWLMLELISLRFLDAALLKHSVTIASQNFLKFSSPSTCISEKIHVQHAYQKQYMYNMHIRNNTCTCIFIPKFNFQFQFQNSYPLQIISTLIGCVLSDMGIQAFIGLKLNFDH